MSDPSGLPPPTHGGFDVFFDWFDHGEDRPEALTYPVLIEELLEKILRAVFRNDAVIANELFKPSGALGSFGVKNRLAYLFGILAREPYDDFNVIGKIRNRFAHDPKVKSFEHPVIKQWVNDLKINKTFKEIRERPIPEERRDFHTWWKFCVTEETKTPKGVYKLALRLYSHRLEMTLKSFEQKGHIGDPEPPES